MKKFLRELAVNKTQIIIEVLTHDFPDRTLCRAARYQSAESPFAEYRHRMREYAGSEATEGRGVDFFDDDLDLAVINQFIKSLPPLKEM